MLAIVPGQLSFKATAAFANNLEHVANHFGHHLAFFRREPPLGSHVVTMRAFYRVQGHG
jgi:hypothetical protein